MSCSKTEKRSVPRWILLVITYLCFVAELAFIIMGFTSYGIIFAGLCFCLLIVFFVLWREEYAHKLLTLQGSLEEALHREVMGNAGKDHGQMKRLRREKEELAMEKARAENRLEKLALENGKLAQMLAEAEQKKETDAMAEAAVRILPSDENLTELDLVTVFSSVAAQMEEPCRKSGIRLRLSYPKELPRYQADERYICLMVRNIIDNSIRYMRRGGSLVITLSNLGNSFFLAFKDDGVGLPQGETEKIFDLNFQGSNRNGGSGLGLAQVKAIVCHYGGTIRARSTDGMGIYIQLPFGRKGTVR